MRVTWLAILACLLTACSNGDPARVSISVSDQKALRALSDRFVAGWLANDRKAVMGVMAPEAVFIPHDGVLPKIGYDAIDRFWFPDGQAWGTVTAYKQDITGVSGTRDRAILYGRFDLQWQDDKQRYHWIGNFLIAARKDDGRWLATHMMASDEDPKITDIATSKIVGG